MWFSVKFSELKLKLTKLRKLLELKSILFYLLGLKAQQLYHLKG